MTCTLSLTCPNPFEIVLIPSICCIFFISYSSYNFVFLRVWFCISCCTTLYQSQFCLTRTLCMTYPNPADWGRTVQALTFPPVFWLLSFFWSTKLIRPLTPTPQVFLDWRTWSKLMDMENEEKIQNMEKFFSSLTEVFWKTAQDWRTSSDPQRVLFTSILRAYQH